MKKIVFCGGGSSGHVMPNIAIIEQLKSVFDIYYVGTNGIEKDICKNYGVHFFECDAVKLVRGKLICNLKIPFRLVRSTAKAKRILKKLDPDLVFCKGGYACLPTAIAASRLKIKMITHESDSSLGLANRLIAGRCCKVLTTFPSLAKSTRQGIYVGAPMRKSLLHGDRRAALEKYGLGSKPVILVLGGGSGSRAINEKLYKILPEILKRFDVFHICGKGNLASIGLEGYVQVEYCYDMADVYAMADFAISRCGSGVAHELLTLKIPTLFIPLENRRSRGDQIKNGEYFLSLGLCHMLRQGELTSKRLIKEIYDLESDTPLKAALSKSHIKCGTDAICREITTTIYASE